MLELGRQTWDLRLAPPLVGIAGFCLVPVVCRSVGADVVVNTGVAIVLDFLG